MPNLKRIKTHTFIRKSINKTVGFTQDTNDYYIPICDGYININFNSQLYTIYGENKCLIYI